MADQKYQAIELVSPRNDNDRLSTTAPALSKSATQRSRKTARKGSFLRLTYETWILELSFMILSILCLAAIIAILIVHNDTPSPQLPFVVTLNAIISILGTISEACLVFVVAATTSQLKWIWFKSSRDLQDLQYIDGAGRGFVGAFQLLFSKPGKSVASLGALITICAIMFQFFLQQVISLPTRTTFDVDTAASVQKGTEFLIGAAEMPFVEAINTGLWVSPAQFEQEPICPTGNCTWTSVQSLGWCSKCEDAMDSVLAAGCNLIMSQEDFQNSGNDTFERECNIMFKDSPGDSSQTPMTFSLNIVDNSSYFVDTPQEQIWIYDEPAASSEESVASDWPIVKIGYVDFLSSEASKVLTPTVAKECTLDLCLRTHDISVLDGRSTNKESSPPIFGKVFDSTPEALGVETGYWRCWKPSSDTTAAIMDLKWEDLHPKEDDPYDPNRRLGFVDRKNFAFCSASPSGPMLVSGPDQWGWGGTIGEMLAGANEGTWSCDFGEGADCFVQLTDSHNRDDRSLSAAMRRISELGIEKVLEGIAASLTKLTVDGHASSLVTGSAGRQVTYVHVRWEWLALPLALDLAGVVLLLMTMLHSKRQGVPMWKSSLLPFLYHGLDDEIRRGEGKSVGIVRVGTAPVRVSDMAAEAEGVVVRLRQGEGGDGRIVLGS